MSSVAPRHTVAIAVAAALLALAVLAVADGARKPTVLVPHDAATGLPTGQRTYKPL